MDEECRKKLTELKRYLPALQNAIDKHMGLRNSGQDQEQRLEKLTALYEVLARPEQHRITMPILVKAETLLQVFENHSVTKEKTESVLAKSRENLKKRIGVQATVVETQDKKMIQSGASLPTRPYNPVPRPPPPPPFLLEDPQFRNSFKSSVFYDGNDVPQMRPQSSQPRQTNQQLQRHHTMPRPANRHFPMQPTMHRQGHPHLATRPAISRHSNINVSLPLAPLPSPANMLKQLHVGDFQERPNFSNAQSTPRVRPNDPPHKTYSDHKMHKKMMAEKALQEEQKRKLQEEENAKAAERIKESSKRLSVPSGCKSDPVPTRDGIKLYRIPKKASAETTLCKETPLPEPVTKEFKPKRLDYSNVNNRSPDISKRTDRLSFEDHDKTLPKTRHQKDSHLIVEDTEKANKKIVKKPIAESQKKSSSKRTIETERITETRKDLESHGKVVQTRKSTDDESKKTSSNKIHHNDVKSQTDEHEKRKKDNSEKNKAEKAKNENVRKRKSIDSADDNVKRTKKVDDKQTKNDKTEVKNKNSLNLTNEKSQNDLKEKKSHKKRTLSDGGSVPTETKKLRTKSTESRKHDRKKSSDVDTTKLKDSEVIEETKKTNEEEVLPKESANVDLPMTVDVPMTVAIPDPDPQPSPSNQIAIIEKPKASELQSPMGIVRILEEEINNPEFIKAIRESPILKNYVELKIPAIEMGPQNEPTIEPKEVNETPQLAKKPKRKTELDILHGDLNDNVNNLMYIKPQRSCRIKTEEVPKNDKIKLKEPYVLLTRIEMKPPRGNFARRGRRHMTISERQPYRVPVVLANNRTMEVDELINYNYSHENNNSIQCLLCDKTFAKNRITQHYKRQHKDSEVLISRLPPQEAERAIEDFKCHEAPELGERCYCRFCAIELPYDEPEELHDHIISHTGEYTWLEDNNEIQMLDMPADITIGYMCRLCHYVQVYSESLDLHIDLIHKNKKDPKDILLIPLFSKMKLAVTDDAQEIAVYRHSKARKSTSRAPIFRHFKETKRPESCEEQPLCKITVGSIIATCLSKGKIEFSCSLCSFKKSDLKHVQWHLDKDHEVDESAYDCSMCGNKLQENSLPGDMAQDHIQQHLEDGLIVPIDKFKLNKDPYDFGNKELIPFHHRGLRTYKLTKEEDNSFSQSLEGPLMILSACSLRTPTSTPDSNLKAIEFNKADTDNSEEEEVNVITISDEEDEPPVPPPVEKIQKTSPAKKDILKQMSLLKNQMHKSTDILSDEKHPLNSPPLKEPVELLDTPKYNKSWGNEDRTAEGIYRIQDIDRLPNCQIFDSDVSCALCQFKNKVRNNVIRHLKQHEMTDNVPPLIRTNPVPHLVNQEKMFDRMTNLADSSQVDKNPVNELTEMDIKKLPPMVDPQVLCKCDKCDHITSVISLLTQHVSTLHKDSKHYACPHCPETVSPQFRFIAKEEEAISEHLKFHGNTLFKCPYCEYFHNNYKIVNNHVGDNHKKEKLMVHTVRESNLVKEWKCKFCPSRAPTAEAILAHLKTRHEYDGKYKCKECAFSPKYENDLKVHFQQSHGGRPVAWVLTYESFYVNAPPPPVVPQAVVMQLASPEKSQAWNVSAEKPRTVRNVLIEQVAPVQARKPKNINYHCVFPCDYTCTNLKILRTHLKKELVNVHHCCLQCNRPIQTHEIATHTGHGSRPWNHADDELFVNTVIENQRKLMNKTTPKRKKP